MARAPVLHNHSDRRREPDTGRWADMASRFMLDEAR